MSLFWLSYRVGNRVLGVIILEAPDLLEARFRASLEGLDRDAEFAEGHELDEAEAAAIPADMIGRMLSPAEAAKLIDRGDKPGRTAAKRSKKPNGPIPPRRRPRNPRSR